MPAIAGDVDPPTCSCARSVVNQSPTARRFPTAWPDERKLAQWVA